jgi:hypothetical protein
MKLRWVLLLVPAAAVAEIAAHEVIHARVPAEGDFERAAVVVRREYRDGDLVVVAPLWLANARRALGPEVMPRRDQARPDEAIYRRLWEVSTRGARASESDGLAPDLEQTFGRVTLRRFPMTPRARVLFDFVEDQTLAEVSEVSGGRVRPCSRHGLRSRCEPGGREQWVGTETISDLDHRPRRCVWAHPLSRGRVLRLHYPRVPRGRTLEGHTATDYVVGRHCGQAPVDLAVEIDGEVVLNVQHHDCGGWTSWQDFSVEVPDGPGTADVAFLVSAPDPEGRHFCFQAQMRSPP